MDSDFDPILYSDFKDPVKNEPDPKRGYGKNQCCVSGFVFYGSRSWKFFAIRFRIPVKKHIFLKGNNKIWGEIKLST